MKKTAVVAAALLVGAGSAYGSGWRLPEQSVNSTARSGAYVAYTPGAAATYFNPANMSWLDDRGYLQIDATWIHLASISYTDNRTPSFNGESEKENFFVLTVYSEVRKTGNNTSMQIKFQGQYDRDLFFKAVALANRPPKNRQRLLSIMLVIAIGGSCHQPRPRSRSSALASASRARAPSRASLAASSAPLRAAVVEAATKREAVRAARPSSFMYCLTSILTGLIFAQTHIMILIASEVG